MNCHEFWSSLAPEPGRAPVPGAEHQAHLDACSDCAARLARHGGLVADLAALANEQRRIIAPARVERRLLSAFRAQAGLPATVPRRGWHGPVLWWAAAAGLLLSTSAFLLRDRVPAPVRHSRPAAVELAQWTAPANTDADGIAVADNDGFIPVPNADGFTVTEDPVDLVRVELPRSSMIAFGIPVSAERAAERVQADVLLGSDGVARAVRFLD